MAEYVYDCELLRNCFRVVKQRFSKIDIDCVCAPASCKQLACTDSQPCQYADSEKQPDAASQARFVIRPLSSDDFAKGVLNVLVQLTAVGNVSESLFLESFKSMSNSGAHYVTVIEESQSKRVIGHGTLFVHELFQGTAYADGKLWGRVEDIVILDQFRGHQLGSIMIHTLNELGRQLGCSALSLECKDSNRVFYEKLGYRVSRVGKADETAEKNGNGSVDDADLNLFLVRRFDN